MKEFLIYFDEAVGEFICEFTKELDKHIGFIGEDKDGEPVKFKLYNFIHDPFFDFKISRKIEERVLVFRYPGSPKGSIYFDEDGIITGILFNPGYLRKIYDPNVEDICDKYIGQKIAIISKDDNTRCIFRKGKLTCVLKEEPIERGKVIVIEGIDGSGKSTLVKNICEKYHNFVSFAVPQRENELGKLIRECIMKGNATQNELALMNTLDKLELVSLINDELNKGNNVILDRWYISQLIYNQCTITGLSTILLNKIVEAIDIDLQVYLDISIDMAIDRIAKRGEQKDTFEQRDVLEKNISAYKDYISKSDFNERKIVAVDGDMEPEVILSIVSHIMYDEGFEF